MPYNFDHLKPSQPQPDIAAGSICRHDASSAFLHAPSTLQRPVLPVPDIKACTCMIPRWDCGIVDSPAWPGHHNLPCLWSSRCARSAAMSRMSVLSADAPGISDRPHTANDHCCLSGSACSCGTCWRPCMCAGVSLPGERRCFVSPTLVSALQLRNKFWIGPVTIVLDDIGTWTYKECFAALRPPGRWLSFYCSVVMKSIKGGARREEVGQRGPTLNIAACLFRSGRHARFGQCK